MNAIEKLITDSITDGVMTQRDHDRIIRDIHRDGKIDVEESALLSKLFSAVQDGRLKIVDTERDLLAARKLQAASAATAGASDRLHAARAQASIITQMIDRAKASGSLTEKEHNRIMQLVQADGKIDAAEREQLSRLFALIQSGEVTISGSKQAAPDGNVLDLRALEAYKRETVESDELREQKALQPVAERTAPDRPAAAGDEVQEVSPDHDEAGAAPALAAASDAVRPQSTQPASQSATLPPTAAPRHPYGAGDDAEPVSDEFLRSFGRICMPRKDGKAFALQNDRLLDVRLTGSVWIKTGAMVGYYGQIKFTREGVFEHGIKKLIKKATTGEGSTLTKASGDGNLYLADAGKKISVIDLRGQALVVSGQNILAFEPTVNWDIVFLKQIAAAVVGGLFNVRLQGIGMAAISTHFDPVVLRVAPGQPVNTDYHATVAWSGGLAPTIRTDVSSQTLIGRTSGETLQMQFQGDGFVIIQPFEELPPPTPE